MRVSAYADAVCVSAPAEVVGPELRPFKRLTSTVRVPKPDCRGQSPARSLRFLGSVVSIQDDGIRVDADDTRKISKFDRIDCATSGPWPRSYGAIYSPS